MEGKPQNSSSAAPKHLTPAQKQLLKRQQELEYWKRHSKQIRSRNLISGLTIGAFVVGLFSYTILSVRQERIMDEIDDEAKTFVMKGPRTGANS
ncbi:cytochrome c oxidase assembly factor 3 homolog, mitochondrial [Rhinichthys klamathensis goyatoka]|uniref:cytochrome c oxidase assembly factor 3 homolog, mitochondrial n=1 Tax=Rhinichthys klamathensis goyatoka TaxID=3034132 RepID=UPI0024B59AC3|nr:cytochrome c oxidase assembly factor 3 homolog, mitochondrial [Rhinichthys klamathensis goyatoka]